MHNLELTRIEKMIYIIRGLKVMLDSDLAELYQVETKALNQAVKRNLDRFPKDFMFQLTEEEHINFLNSVKFDSDKWGGRRHLPFAFTECGVAMLSSVLNSPRAISVNISIMRTFVKLRNFLAMDNSLVGRVSKLENGTNKLFRIVFERMDVIDEKIEPKLSPDRKKIGLKILSCLSHYNYITKSSY